MQKTHKFNGTWTVCGRDTREVDNLTDDEVKVTCQACINRQHAWDIRKMVKYF